MKLKKAAGDIDMEPLKKTLQELQKEKEDLENEYQSFKKREKVINKPAPRKQEELSEEEKEERQREFVKKHEKELKEYGLLRKYEDSKRFLTEKPHLACEETANYLVVWCINLEVEGKSELMAHVAHQCICMQYVLELGKQLNVDPRACVPSFFSRIQLADQPYKDAFLEELRAFKERVKERARIRLEKAQQEVEEEERQKRLGPGGLDPLEVFDTLPETLRKCFEERDIPMLQKAIAELPEDEARYHMKRCVDSGLWIPDAQTSGTMQPQEEKPSTEES
ncbi:CDC37 [Cordylochernes scorpioides]|uniref:CDC37 n=1 Tax=Cordylochernes scorpioides TaxID=51811 RepID=A0ABY6KGA0_9ARAC|nr:CDC37 [Cordylochernes scorpioides]